MYAEVRKPAAHARRANLAANGLSTRISLGFEGWGSSTVRNLRQAGFERGRSVRQSGAQQLRAGTVLLRFDPEVVEAVRTGHDVVVSQQLERNLVDVLVLRLI